MFILERLRAFSFDFATIGHLGAWFGGGAVASVLAFPLIFSLRFFANMTPNFFGWLLLSIFIFYVFIILLAVGHISDRYPTEIVLDKIVGLAISFWSISLQWKLMIVGFCAFHVINFFRPFFFYKIFEEKIESISLGLKIISCSIVSGVITNLFMRLIVWIVG